MERLPLALVGCGTMGRRHIRGLAALAGRGLLDLDLVAVHDPERDAAERAADEAAERLGSRPRVHDSLEALLADDAIIALDVVTPPATHHAVVVPAMRAGRHVLCEKPISITLRGCRAILAAAEAAPTGTVLAVHEQYRLGPANRVARAVIAAGMLGEVFLVSTLHAGGDDRILLTPWRHLREQGAIALDNGVHLADMHAFLLGSDFGSVWGRGFIAEPVRRQGPPPSAADGFAATAYAEARSRGPETVTATGEDSVIALYRMESGASAFLTWLPSGPGHVYLERTVHGRDGSVVIPPDRSGGDLLIRTADGALGLEDARRELAEDPLDEVTTRLFPSPVHPHEPFEVVDAAHIGASIHDFGRAILERRPPEVDGAAGASAVAAILGAIESEALGRAVTRTELLEGRVDAAQRDIDEALGLV